LCTVKDGVILEEKKIHNTREERAELSHAPFSWKAVLTDKELSITKL